MTTVYSVARKVIQDSIDMEYVKECGYKTVAEVYHSEFGNYRSLSVKACKEYLQGLPSVCSVPLLQQ